MFGVSAELCTFPPVSPRWKTPGAAAGEPPPVWAGRGHGASLLRSTSQGSRPAGWRDERPGQRNPPGWLSTEGIPTRLQMDAEKPASHGSASLSLSASVRIFSEPGCDFSFKGKMYIPFEEERSKLHFPGIMTHYLWI